MNLELIIALTLGGIAVILLEVIMHRIQTTEYVSASDIEIVGIRRHSSTTDMWPNTTVSGNPDAFFARHRTSEHGEVYDPERTEVIEYEPSTGRHSVDNRSRQIVDPDWKPVIGSNRIAVLLTDTSAYAIQVQRVPYALPASPFSSLTVPSDTLPAVRSGYYAFR